MYSIASHVKELAEGGIHNREPLEVDILKDNVEVIKLTLKFILG